MCKLDLNDYFSFSFFSFYDSNRQRNQGSNFSFFSAIVAIWLHICPVQIPIHQVPIDCFRIRCPLQYELLSVCLLLLTGSVPQTAPSACRPVPWHIPPNAHILLVALQGGFPYIQSRRGSQNSFVLNVPKCKDFPSCLKCEDFFHSTSASQDLGNIRAIECVWR